MFHFPLLLESHNDKRHGVDWGLETMSRIALLIQYIRNTPTHGWEFSLSSHKKTGTLDMGFYAQTWQPATSYVFYHIFNLIQNKKFPERKVLLLRRSGAERRRGGGNKKRNIFYFHPHPGGCYPPPLSSLCRWHNRGELWSATKNRRERARTNH